MRQKNLYLCIILTIFNIGCIDSHDDSVVGNSVNFPKAQSAIHLDNASKNKLQFMADKSNIELIASTHALSNSFTQSVLDFAQESVETSTQLSNDLKYITLDQGVNLQNGINKSDSLKIESMLQLKGKEFDMAYLRLIKEQNDAVSNSVKIQSQSDSIHVKPMLEKYLSINQKAKMKARSILKRL